MSLEEMRAKMRETTCKGCLTYGHNEKSIYQCNIKPIKDGKKCPCSVCLVKMRCVTPCDLFYKHGKRYSGFQS